MKSRRGQLVPAVVLYDGHFLRGTRIGQRSDFSIFAKHTAYNYMKGEINFPLP